MSEDTSTESAPATERQLPPARFDFFVTSLVMEAFIAMGEMAHPLTGEKKVNLAQARYLVDILGVLQEKTKGNLTDEEDRMLMDSLYQLRLAILKQR